MARYHPLTERADLPRGMLHADIFPDNTLYDTQTGRLAVIDWEV
jgi:aminoglycoside phosphotransferase (APT) family kinase protein